MTAFRPSRATPMQRRGVFVFAWLLLAFCQSAGNAHGAAMPRLAIVMDDLGNNAALDLRALRLPGQVAASILPLTPHAARDAGLAKARGLLIIAHLPMQAENGKAMGPGGLSGQMSEPEFKKQLTLDLDSIPGAGGASNHMGSYLTQDRRIMRWTMEVLQGRKPLFFLDSRTTRASVAADSAQRAGIPALERDVFLDHDRNGADIEKQFDRTLQVARRKGSAIAIGHPFPETLTVLERRLPQLAGQGFRLVRLDELLHPPARR